MRTWLWGILVRRRGDQCSMHLTSDPHRLRTSLACYYYGRKTGVRGMTDTDPHRLAILA
jgi:hypothetical protein